MRKKIRGLDYLKSLLEDESFLATVEDARASDAFTRQVVPGRVLLNHGIPARFWKVVDRYIDTREVDESLIDEPVRVAHIDGGVVLKLSHDVTQPELRAYIDKYWKSDIKFQLDLFAPERRKRLTVQPFASRDQAVYRDYLHKAVSGLTDATIGDKYHIDPRTVRRIVKKFK